MAPRTFTSSPAVRVRVPVWLALGGASGCGKTYSGLRVATGMAKSDPGKIFGLDSESNRMKSYAPKPGEKADGVKTFDFVHVPFDPPFAPEDYLGALEYCAKEGARHVIVDSGSHWHDGVGGMLEMHEKLTQELAARWKCSLEKAQTSAWIEPKARELRCIDAIKRLPLNIIWCFRAEPKTDFQGSKPKTMGFMPIIGKKLLWEMTASCLLLPGVGNEGVPQWHPDEMGEKATIKLPIQFREIFDVSKRRQLDENTGAAIAAWAAGEAPASAPTVSAAPVLARAPTERVKVLIQTLEAAGIGTGPLRQKWIEERIGRKIVSTAEITPAELATCEDFIARDDV